MFDGHEITVSLEKLQGSLVNPEFLLYELGKEVERIANRELQRNQFKNPLSLTGRSPIQQKPFTRYRRPVSESSHVNGWSSIRPNRGVTISRLTPTSVTVIMPREILKKLRRRLPELEELFKGYLTDSTGTTDIGVRLSSSPETW